MQRLETRRIASKQSDSHAGIDSKRCALRCSLRGVSVCTTGVHNGYANAHAIASSTVN